MRSSKDSLDDPLGRPSNGNESTALHRECSHSNDYWGKAFIDDIFGLEKASKLDRTGSCEARKIRWTIHSDDPVTEMNPLRCIENAVTRTMWKSDSLLSPDERVSVDAALRAVTLDAAWQFHSEHEVGSLEIGKFADFVVLEKDPSEVETTDIGKIKIEETWVDGRCVYSSSAAGSVTQPHSSTGAL